MSTVSGLDHLRSIKARELAVKAGLLSLHHAPAVHYTEGDQRWQGITRKLDARKGQFATEADCSSSVTWWVGWNGLHLPFGLGDLLNADKWLGGFTGTLSKNGREVLHKDQQLHADVQLYGSAYPYLHTAMLVGKIKGKRHVISHGSEGGPYLLPIDYRDDAGPIHRYI